MALGVVAIVAGLFAVLTGTGGQLDGSAATPSVESEFRFFAVFWAAYGAAALWVAPRIERETAAVRALALFLFAGGLARVIASIASGRPHSFFIGLMLLELLLPFVMVLGQSRLRNRWASGSVA